MHCASTRTDDESAQLGEAAFEGGPGEHRALHTHRELRNARERHRIFQHLGVAHATAARAHQLSERLNAALEVNARQPRGEPGENGCGCLRNAASLALPSEAGYDTRVIDPDTQSDLVAAGRVAVEALGVERLDQPLTIAPLGVLENELLVQAGQRVAHASTPK